MMDTVLGVLFILAMGITAALIAKRRNRNTVGWLVVGLLLSLLGVIWVSCLPPLAPKRPVGELGSLTE
jgi:hypothetical protein